MEQNKTSLVQLLFTTLCQETRWAYSTTLPSPPGETMNQPTNQRGLACLHS